jgi:hypothetical protein
VTLTAQLQTLIDKVDTAEQIRDQIGAILLVEQAHQQTLATAALKDPRLWALRVFTGRSNPWGEFSPAPDQLSATPIVNVDFDSDDFDKSASNRIERQKTTAGYNVDCYGYGVSAAAGAGHTPGDAAASFEAMRAARLVRNILMSSYYTYLGLQGTVWGRWVQGRQLFQPSDPTRLPTEHVLAVRLKLEVEFNELSPQYVAQTIESIGIGVTRASDGHLYFEADFPES